MADNKDSRFIVPAAKAEWLHIVTPDTKFDPLGKYKVNVFLTKEQLDDFCIPLKPMLDEALVQYQAEEDEKAKKTGKKAKPLKVSDNQPWTAAEMEDGTFCLKLSRAAAFTDKETNLVKEIKLPVLDGTGKRIPDDILAGERFGNGTVVRCVVTARPYNMATTGVGISLRLEKVQILEKVSYDSGPDNELGAYEGAAYASPDLPTERPVEATSDQVNYTV